MFGANMDCQTCPKEIEFCPSVFEFALGQSALQLLHQFIERMVIGDQLFVHLFHVQSTIFQITFS